jgi:hypothetical protein
MAALKQQAHSFNYSGEPSGWRAELRKQRGSATRLARKSALTQKGRL